MAHENLYLPGAHLARVYSFAVAYPDTVPSYVAENGKMLLPECASGSFAEFFINRMRSLALKGPVPDQVYQEAMHIASVAGAPHLGSQLAAEFLEDRTDMLLLAGYLNDLLSVIPALIDGDSDPYQRTQLYTNMSFVWQNAACHVLPGFLQKLQEMAFELNQWYVNKLMEEIRVNYLRKDWKRNVKVLKGSIEKYEIAKDDGNTVMLLVHSAVVLGMSMKYAPLLGITEEEIETMHSGTDVDLLVEWLRENGWTN